MVAAIVCKRIQDVRLVLERALAHLEVYTITYIAAVRACEKCGQWDHTCRIFVEMVATIVCKWVQDVRLVLEMAIAHLEVDTITYNAVVQAWRLMGVWL
jgi:pentatricopeptide repeat protein